MATTATRRRLLVHCGPPSETKHITDLLESDEAPVIMQTITVGLVEFLVESIRSWATTGLGIFIAGVPNRDVMAEFEARLASLRAELELDVEEAKLAVSTSPI